VHGFFSNRIATCRYVVLLASFTLVPVSAFADSVACPADSTSLECRMLGFLHWLEAAAWVLAILLLIVIGLAIHLIRKNRISRKEGR
jgi:disulfide bond formation protein DsbB